MASAVEKTDVLVAFDVEATGMLMSGPHANAMVELGACAMFSDNRHTELGRFSAQMRVPDGRAWEKHCVEEFWDVVEGMPQKKKEIEVCKTEPEEVMRAFIDWVEALVKDHANGDAKRIQFVSDTAGFDAGWVNMYLAEYAHHQPLDTFFDGHRAVLDTSSFAAGVTRHTDADKLKFMTDTGAKWYKVSAAARAALRVPSDIVPITKHDHTAVNDARHLLETHLILLEHM